MADTCSASPLNSARTPRHQRWQQQAKQQANNSRNDEIDRVHNDMKRE